MTTDLLVDPTPGDRPPVTHTSRTVPVQQTRPTGWYLRVIQAGSLGVGDSFKLLDRPYPALTIDWANQVMFAKPLVRRNDLANCQLMAEFWRRHLQSRTHADYSDRDRQRLHRD